MRLALILFAGSLAVAVPAAAQSADEASEGAAAEEPALAIPPTADPVLPIARPPPEPRSNLKVQPEGAIDTSNPETGFLTGATLRRTVDEDPYGALGVRMGSLLFYPSVDFAAGATSNATSSHKGKPAGFGIVSPELLLKSDWSRHQATVALRGSYEGFTAHVEDSTTAEAEATARLDFSAGWAANLRALYKLGQESVSDPDYPEGVDSSPNVHQLIGGIALTGGDGPGLVELGLDADRTTYDRATAGGVTVDQGDRDNTLYTGRLRLGYALSPTLTPFIEGEALTRVYDRAVDDNGIDRTSHGGALRAGVLFDRSPVSSGEIAVGSEWVDFDDPALRALRTLSVEGSLVWSPTRLVTVTGKLATAINPTTDPASSGSIVHEGSLDVAYAWRDDVTLDWLGSVKQADYQGIDTVDWTYQLGVAATWKLSRFVHLKAGYLHEWRESNAAGGDYTADTVRLDLRLQR